jgi:hypothetical protein
MMMAVVMTKHKAPLSGGEMKKKQKKLPWQFLTNDMSRSHKT